MNMNYYLQAIGFIHDVTKDENMVIGQTYDGATMLTGENADLEVVVTIKKKHLRQQMLINKIFICLIIPQKTRRTDMQLYQLKQNYQTIVDYIDNADEIDEHTLFDTWESIDEAFDDKVISTAYVIRNNDADIETIANEIKRLTN